MSEYGSVTILQSTRVDIKLLSVAIIFYLNSHYSTVIAKNNGNPKALWNIFKKFLHRSLTIILPHH